MIKIHKENRGITLIALVVTIVVLLILAGTSIAMLTGDDGIITNAQKAQIVNQEGEIIDKIGLAYSAIKTEAMVKMSTNPGYQPIEHIEELAKTASKELGIETPQREEVPESVNDGYHVYYQDGGSIITILYGDNRFSQKVESSLKNGKYSNIIGEISLSTTGVEYSKMPTRVDEIMEGAYKKEENRNIKGEYEYSYNNPVIPRGFIAVETSNASWKIDEKGIPKGWNNGLVIKDDNNNEFVWVPCALQENNENVTQYKSYVKSEKFTSYGVDVDSIQDLEKYIPVENELSQIEKYQGFYVGRYETGLSELIERVSNNEEENTVNLNTSKLEYNNKEIKPVIQKNKTIWNFVSRDNADILAKSIVNTEEVKSGLITGKQWDTILQWFITNGIYNNTNPGEYYTKLGNFYDSEYSINGVYGIDEKNSGIADGKQTYVIWHNGRKNKAVDTKLYLGTGTYNKEVKNIYDIYGNAWEMTAETDKNGKLVQRGIGANARAGISAGVHRHGNSNQIDATLGFRVVLYIK